MYMVIARASMDDLPMLLTASRDVAVRYTKTKLGQDLRAAADAMEIDTSIWHNVAILTFKAGRPTRLQIIRDITASETRVANDVFVRPKAGGK